LNQLQCQLFSVPVLNSSLKNMKKLILLISITIFGWIGWWLGDHIGIMTAYWVGFVGSLAGVYVGVRINQNYLN
jgi:hypothetical protein